MGVGSEEEGLLTLEEGSQLHPLTQGDVLVHRPLFLIPFCGEHLGPWITEPRLLPRQWRHQLQHILCWLLSSSLLQLLRTSFLSYQLCPWYLKAGSGYIVPERLLTAIAGGAFRL